MKRVELHAHTKKSKMDGLIDIKELIEFAKQDGMKAVAITDHGSVAAFPEAYYILQDMKRNKEISGDFKLIYGTEAYIIDDQEDEVTDKSITFHATILVQNQEGFRNIYHAMSEAATTYYRRRPRLPKSILKKYRGGLLIGSACDSGEIFWKLAYGECYAEVKRVARFYDFLEIQPVSNHSFMFDLERYSEVNCVQDIQEINKKILKMGKELGIPVVATSDAHYLYPEDVKGRRVIMNHAGYQDQGVDEDLGLYIKSTDDMIKEFEYLGKEKAYEVVVLNTNAIANMIEADTPIALSTSKEFIRGNVLRMLCERKAKEIYGESIPENVRERLEWELCCTEEGGYENIYLHVKELVDICNLESYEVSFRGNIGASLIAYLLGVTEINPLDYHLPPYFLMGYAGEKKPNVNICVPCSKRCSVQFNLDEINGIENAYYSANQKGITFNEAVSYVQEYEADYLLKFSTEEKEKIINCICGVLKEVNKYPFSKLLVPSGIDIRDYSPLRLDDNGCLITEFERYEIDHLFYNLHVMSQVSNELLWLLADRTGVNPSDVSVKNKTVMELFVLGSEINKKFGLEGIVEFEGEYMQILLRDIKPKNFDELIKVCSLSHSSNAWEDNQKELLLEGKINVGNLITSREDVYEALINYGISEQMAFEMAERIRKGKNFTQKQKKILRKTKIPKWFVDTCSKMRYLPSKADGIAYVLNNWRLAYYKIFHYDVFLECVLYAKKCTYDLLL